MSPAYQFVSDVPRGPPVGVGSLHQPQAEGGRPAGRQQLRDVGRQQRGDAVAVQQVHVVSEGMESGGRLVYFFN